MTFEQVKETYHRLLLNEESRRMMIVRGFPPKNYDLVKDDQFD
eukprot:CAMPEP_0168607736 /NCGR_PEP_ID=MMETSP0449_2-20121227/223_1 /TAXON_ID=1082188 /ORGANISM="Strombidium rassoulzadegani, Strain ras09" /LENGTH=42 /DNA_ID= /DNA_START= /DNA_END= /DNA_ORIENTATION=